MESLIMIMIRLFLYGMETYSSIVNVYLCY